MAAAASTRPGDCRRGRPRCAERRMTDTVYQVTIDDRVLRVQLRRTQAGCLVRVDDGDEQRVEMGASHGAVYWLALGERRAELLARTEDDQVTLTIGGLGQRAEVVDEARARLASVAGGGAPRHARRELRAPLP